MITAEQARSIRDRYYDFRLDIFLNVLNTAMLGESVCLIDISKMSLEYLDYIQGLLLEYGYILDTVYDDENIYLKIVW